MEKERYECKYNEKLMKHYTFDNGNKEELGYKTTVRTLNQQDARIKELENQVEKWKQDYENCSKLEKNLSKEHQYCLDNWRECEKENQQLKEKLNNYEMLMGKYNVEDFEHLDIILFCLTGATRHHLKEIKDKHKKELKQSQNQKAIEVLEDLKEFMNKNFKDFGLVYKSDIDKEIDDKIKKLRSEK